MRTLERTFDVGLSPSFPVRLATTGAPTLSQWVVIHNTKSASVHLHNTKLQRGQFAPVDVDDVDLEIFDERQFGEIPAKETIPVQLRITHIERGQIDPVEVDDSIFEWSSLEGKAIGLCPPLEAHTITASVREVREGQPRAVAMDELDWELLDFD